MSARYQFNWKDGRMVTMEVDELGHIVYAEISAPDGFLPGELSRAPWPTWARQCDVAQRYRDWPEILPRLVQ